MAEIIRIEMANCKNRLLGEIADRQFTRRDVAQTYWYATQSSEKVDWEKVNRAIVERWSRFGLEWIKRQAHTKKCFEPKRVGGRMTETQITPASHVKAVRREVAAKTMKQEAAD